MNFSFAVMRSNTELMCVEICSIFACESGRYLAIVCCMKQSKQAEQATKEGGGRHFRQWHAWVLVLVHSYPLVFLRLLDVSAPLLSAARLRRLQPRAHTLQLRLPKHRVHS